MFFATPVAGQRRWLRYVLERTGGDRSGAVSVIFALVILPLMIAMGAAVDYAIAARTKEMLQAAADSAAARSAQWAAMRGAAGYASPATAGTG